MQIRPPRFKILALAPFDAAPERVWDGPPAAVERTSLDEVIARFSVQYYLPLDAHLCPAGGIQIDITSLKAFHPDSLVSGQPYLSALLEAGEAFETAYKKGKTADEINRLLNRWPELPAVELPTKPASPAKRPAQDSIDNLLEMVALPDQENTAVQHKIQENPYVSLLQTILKKLFDDPRFRQMEAAWRGLRLLLQQGVLEDNVAVEIVPVHAQCLEKTIEALTPEILSDPPGLVLLDLPFSNTPVSMSLLATAAQWASNLMVPLTTWAAVDFLQIDRWENLKKLPFLPTHLEKPEYAKFKTIASSEGGRWLCLMCNRFLVRYPYGPDNSPRRVVFTENRPLWVSPIWACGVLTAKSISKTGWPTHLCRKPEYSVEDLAFPSQGARACTEAAPVADRFDQLLLSGITPLIPDNKRDRVYLHKAIAVNGVSLAYQLLLSQITQFVLWCKDNLPDERDPDMLEVQLKLAFQVFSEQSSPAGLESVEIGTSPPDGENRILLQIKVTPSRSILSTGQPVELTLNW